MESQEAKRRRFLERNRVAASKCRQKKKAWVQDLEAEAREAQAMSKQLRACVGALKGEVLQLKNELLKHNTCDCTPIRQYLSNEAVRVADGGSGSGSGGSGAGGGACGVSLAASGSAPRHSVSSLSSVSDDCCAECKIHPALQSGGLDLTIDGDNASATSPTTSMD